MDRSDMVLSGLSVGAGLLATAFFPWRYYVYKEFKSPQIIRIVNELAVKANIQKPIEIVKVAEFSIGAQALGVNFFSTRAVIAIDSFLVRDLANGKEDWLKFILAHELSHVAHNDWIYSWVGFGVISFLSMFIISFLSLYISILQYAMIKTVLHALIFKGLFAFLSKYLEKRADLEAIKLAEELPQAAIDFFSNIQKNQLTYRNDPRATKIQRFFRSILINSEGDVRFDFFHPSLQERIDYIRAAQSTKNQKPGVAVV